MFSINIFFFYCSFHIWFKRFKVANTKVKKQIGNPRYLETLTVSNEYVYIEQDEMPSTSSGATQQFLTVSQELSIYLNKDLAKCKLKKSTLQPKKTEVENRIVGYQREKENIEKQIGLMQRKMGVSDELAKINEEINNLKCKISHYEGKYIEVTIFYIYNFDSHNFFLIFI